MTFDAGCEPPHAPSGDQRYEGSAIAFPDDRETTTSIMPSACGRLANLIVRRVRIVIIPGVRSALRGQ